MPSSLQRVETQGTTVTAGRFRSNSNLSNSEIQTENTVDHPVEPRARISILPAVCMKIVADDPICWLEFTEENIITSDKAGMYSIFLFSKWVREGER